MSGFFYTAVISFFAGIAIGSWWSVSYDLIIVVLFGSLLSALLWAWRHSRQSLLLSVCGLMLVVGLIRFDITHWQPLAPALLNQIGTPTEITGVVVREPDVRDSSTHIYLRPTDTQERILLYAPRITPVKYGDALTVTGTLAVPEAFETDFGRTFNYPGYLSAQGVDLVMYRPTIVVVGQAQGNWLLTQLLKGKHSLMRSIEGAVPEPHAGLGEGLLLGVKSALGDQLETVFRRTGIIHIVVLSGYNVMLVVTFVMTILAYICGLRSRLVFGVAAIAGFALVVGLSATVVRASIMASLILVAHTTGRRYEVTRALFFAGTVMVLINPYLLIFDPGFQLSFLATLGLIMLGPIIEQRLTAVPQVIGIRSFLMATLATQIFVLPFLLYQIGEFSVVAVLVNVLVLPMVPVAMLLTFLTGLVGLLHGGAASVIGFIAYLSLGYILLVAEWFAALPWAAFVVPAFSWPVMVSAYILLALLMWWLMQPAKETDPLAEWVIEDDTEDGEELRSSPSAPSIFFRN